MKLQVADLCFSYNSIPVLTDVSFCLNHGQIMSVLGANGAGKTTLLRCMNRILNPRRGSVLVEGADLLRTGRNRAAQLLGYVPQRHPETRLTVFETVLLGRKPHIRWFLEHDDYLLVERTLEQIGIEHLAMRPLSELSGGEVQKVMIARALAQAPEVLLLDEPTSNLDLKNQLEVMGLIRGLVAKGGLSAVVAIHDLSMALRFADSFVLLKNGCIHGVAARDGLTAEMIEQVYGVRVGLKRFGGHTVVVAEPGMGEDV